MRLMNKLIKMLVLFSSIIIMGLSLNCERASAASQSIVCKPVEVEICSICGNDYTDGSVCMHYKGKIYNGDVCDPIDDRLCNICDKDYSYCSHIEGTQYGGLECRIWRKCDICGNDYDDPTVCPHKAGEMYGGEVCTTYIIEICNLCGNDYNNGEYCEHIRGQAYEDGGCYPTEQITCSICDNDYSDPSVCPHKIGQWYDGEICTVIGICSICGNDYNDPSVCPHRIGQRYGGTTCKPYYGQICNICNYNYRNGSLCNHYEGQIYNGTECTTTKVELCNICGYNYFDGEMCPHIRGREYDLGLFLESDLDLEPEVQQMISYYDDLYLYSQTAYEMDLFSETHNNALQSLCIQEVDKLRALNYVETEEESNEFIYQAAMVIGGFLPVVGPVIDTLDMILSDPEVVQAATLEFRAAQIIESNKKTLAEKIAKNVAYRYTVYELYDQLGNVKYVGRTRQELEVRKKTALERSE